MVAPDGRLRVVTDAFCGPKTRDGDFADAPELLGAFPSHGIANGAAYHDWATAALRSSEPTVIIPCHGAIIGGKQVASKALELVADLI